MIQETIIKQEKIFEEIFEEQIEEQFDEIANIEEIHEEIQEEFNKIIEPVIMKIEEPPEDTAPRCEISNTPFSRTIKGLNLERETYHFHLSNSSIYFIDFFILYFE